MLLLNVASFTVSTCKKTFVNLVSGLFATTPAAKPVASTANADDAPQSVSKPTQKVTKLPKNERAFVRTSHPAPCPRNIRTSNRITARFIWLLKLLQIYGHVNPCQQLHSVPGERRHPKRCSSWASQPRHKLPNHQVSNLQTNSYFSSKGLFRELHALLGPAQWRAWPTDPAMA